MWIRLGKSLALTLGLLLLLLFLCTPNPSQAADYTWNYAGNGYWTESAKWSPNGVPNGASISVQIDGKSYQNVTVTLNRNTNDLGGLQVDGGDTLHFSHTTPPDLDMWGLVTNNGTIDTGTDGQFRAKANLTITGLGVTILRSNGALDADSGVTITNDGNHTIAGKGSITSAMTNYGLINANAGDLLTMSYDIAHRGTLQASGHNGILALANNTLTTAVVGGTTYTGIIKTDGHAYAGVYLHGVTWTGYGVKILGPGKIYLDGTSVRTRIYQGLNIASGGELTVPNGNTLEFDNSVVSNYGVIKLTGSSSNTLLKLNDTIFSGSGAIDLGSSSYNKIQLESPGAKFTNRGGHTIRGAGLIEAPVYNGQTGYSGGKIIATNGTLQITGTITPFDGAIGGGYDVSAGTFDYARAGGGTLTSKIVMSGGSLTSTSATPCNYASTDASGYGNFYRPLTINASGVLLAEGGTLNFGANSSLTLGTNSQVQVTGTLANNAVTDMALSTSATLAVAMDGGTLSAGTGKKFSVYDLTGYGTVSAPLDNDHTVTAAVGALTLANTVTNTGHTLSANSGATLKLTATVNGGAVNPGAGTVELDGATLSAVALSSGAVNVTGSSTLNSSSSASFSGGGVLTINATKSLTFESGATLSNTGAINVNGTLANNTASGMTLSSAGGGSVVLGDGALSSSTGQTFASYNLSGKGTVSAPLTNASGGAVNASGSGSLTLAGNVTNTGATLKTDGSGNTLILGNGSSTITVSNGAVNPNGGAVQLNKATLSGVTVQTGAVTVTESSALSNSSSATFASGGVLTINTGKSLTFETSATLSNLGALNVNGTLANNTASGMTLSSAGGGSAVLGNGALSSSTGQTFTSYNLSGKGSVNAPLINSSGGAVTASGSGTLTLAGSVTNIGATLTTAGSGNTLALGGGAADMQVSGGTVDTGGGAVTLNRATLAGVSLAAASGSVTVSGDSIITTGSPGEVNISGTASLTINPGESLTFNSGTVLNNTGSLAINGALTNNTGSAMTLSSPAGGSASMGGGSLNGNPFNSHSLSGYGSLNANLTNTGTLWASGGTLAVNAALANQGALNVAGTLSFGGSGVLSNAVGSTMSIHGSVANYTASVIDFGDAAVTMNNGTLSATKSGFAGNNLTGVGWINAPYTNNGSFTVNTGGGVIGDTMTLGHASFTNNGSVTVNSSTYLSNNSGASINLGSGVTLAGGTLGSMLPIPGQSFTTTDMQGYGAISANLTNSGNVYASSNSQPLQTSGTIEITNTGGILWGASPSSAGSLWLNAGTTVTGGRINPDCGGQQGLVYLNGATFNSVNLGPGTVAVRQPSILAGGVTQAGNTLNVEMGTLTVSQAVSGSGQMTVNKGAALLQFANLGTGGFTLAQTSAWQVEDTFVLDAKGHFSFAQQDESLWKYAGQDGVAPGLIMSGRTGVGAAQLLEVGSYDYVLDSQGWVRNFHATGLTLDDDQTYVRLVDLLDNGHRGGAHSGAEALYVDSLVVNPDTTLDLNGLWLYTYLGGQLHAVADGEGYLFGGGTIIGSPVPTPAAWLLMASGLLGLIGVGRRYRM